MTVYYLLKSPFIVRDYGRQEYWRGRREGWENAHDVMRAHDLLDATAKKEDHTNE